MQASTKTTHFSESKAETSPYNRSFSLYKLARKLAWI